MRAAALIGVTLAACAPAAAAPTATPPTAAPPAAVASSSPAPPEAATTRYRAGDYVVYRYKGDRASVPVTLRELVEEQNGNHLSIRVTAERGAEQREWIQKVTDTPENQKNNVVDELLEVRDGVATKIDTKEIMRLYEWVLFMPDGRATDVLVERHDLTFAGATFSCSVRTGKNTWHGRSIRFAEHECPDFLWTHGPALYTEEQSGTDVWSVEVVEFGRYTAGSAPAPESLPESGSCVMRSGRCQSWHRCAREGHTTGTAMCWEDCAPGACAGK